MLQSSSYGLSLGELRCGGIIGVEHEVPPRNERSLPAITDTPIDEEGALVLQLRRERAVLDAEVADLVTPKPVLSLPPSEVGVDEDVPLDQQGCSTSDDEYEPVCHRLDLPPELLESVPVKELGESERGQVPEDRIISAEVRLDELIDA
jgi:hypothetical protein